MKTLVCWMAALAVIAGAGAPAFAVGPEAGTATVVFYVA
jgi:hypothetical protein